MGHLMAKIVYRTAHSHATTLDVPDGTSLMKAAVEAGIPGILGECGGNAMCATCHVYVDKGGLHSLATLSDDEDEMLDCTAAERTDASRLSCQLIATPELDGLTVDVPQEQT
jgi:2Fe-2S ferredoxin